MTNDTKTGTPARWSDDHENLLARLQDALALADSLQLSQVAIYIDLARATLSESKTMRVRSG